jgi:hypothetical protein
MFTMPSLILLVFVIQLAIHLISTFGGQAINDLVCSYSPPNKTDDNILTTRKLWLLYTKLPVPQSKQAAAGATLRKEVVRLNREMTNTSAQDDFAKWAKLRRQHDKKKAEYDENGTRIPRTLSPTMKQPSTNSPLQHNPSNPSAPTSTASHPPCAGSAHPAPASSFNSGSPSKPSSGSRKAGRRTTSSGC